MKSRERPHVTRTTGHVSKVCGNCRYHNTYRYPDLVFCFSKFANKQKSVVSILFSCDEWENKLQECCCLEDYQKKQKKTAK